jgi:hypothetical protein
MYNKLFFNTVEFIDESWSELLFMRADLGSK